MLIFWVDDYQPPHCIGPFNTAEEANKFFNTHLYDTHVEVTDQEINSLAEIEAEKIFTPEEYAEFINNFRKNVILFNTAFPTRTKH